MTTMLTPWLRWLLLVPASIGGGFAAAGLLSSLASIPAFLAYPAAFLSGLAYVVTALVIAHAIAPAHKRIVTIILSFFVVGDLAVVHLVLQADLLGLGAPGEWDDAGIGVLLTLLRAEDWGSLAHGGLAKVFGALAGLPVTWLMLRNHRAAATSPDAALGADVMGHPQGTQRDHKQADLPN